MHVSTQHQEKKKQCVVDTCILTHMLVLTICTKVGLGEGGREGGKSKLASEQDTASKQSTWHHPGGTPLDTSLPSPHIRWTTGKLLRDFNFA